MKQNILPQLKKYLPFLLKAREDNLNEADTSQRIFKVFEDVFGYDPMTDISREVPIKSTFADMAIKIDGVAKLLIEAKAASVTLRERHVDQAEGYASKEGVQFVVLTNGVDWKLYHLAFETKGVQYEPVFSISLSKETLASDADLLSILHKASVKNGGHETYWKERSAIGPESIAACIYSDDVLRLMRRQIHQNREVLMDVEDIAASIQNMFSEEVREKIGPVKIRHRRPTRALKPETAVAEPPKLPPQIDQQPPASPLSPPA